MPNGICQCGKSFDECKYPVSHSHPTVNTITLPAVVVKATRDRATTDYSSADRAAMNDFEL